MRPHVTIHVMMSVDGRLDGLTENLGLYYELAGTIGADAILSSSNTMLAAYPDPVDTPQETRERYSEQLLAVVDSRGRIPNWRRIRSEPWWGDCVVICSTSTATEYVAYLEEVGIPRIVAGRERADLGLALEQLATEHGVKRIRVDSGGTLNGVLLRQGLVDEVSVLVEPRLVGGVSSRSIFIAEDLASDEDALPAVLSEVRSLEGGYVWLRYTLGEGDSGEGS